MTTLTSTATFTVASAATATETISVPIIAAGAPGVGKGRLIHPTLGTYNYLHAPDRWSGFDTDAIIPPVWANTRTLGGAANVLWQGNLRDVEVEEVWEAGDLGGSMAHLRALLTFWQNPVDPSTGYVQWFPQYANALGYRVMLLEVSVAGRGVTLDYVSRNGWARGAISLRMRIAERIEA